MTAALALPTSLFHSPKGAFPWQAEGAVEGYLRGSMLAAWDAGLGKGPLAYLLACLLFEDAEIDTCVVLCESGKVLDYVGDFARFTELQAVNYTGTPAHRAAVLAGRPQVLVTTYETARNDICTFKPSSRAVASAGPLTQFLIGRRPLLVMDETTKLANRGSGMYRATEWLLKQLRQRHGLRAGHVRVLDTTATTVTRSPEAHFNLARLLDPAVAGTVERFEHDHVSGWDPNRPGVPTGWKNLSPATCPAGVTSLAEKLAPLTHRVRKTDPGPAPHFPVMDERHPTVVELGDLHRNLLAAIARQFAGVGDEERGALYGLLRQAAGHPSSLLVGGGRMAGEVSRIIGEAGLRRIGSAKADALRQWVTAEGSKQSVVFTFYGRSTLPLLAEELGRDGVSVSLNHGGMTLKARQRAKQEFTDGDTQVFLSSDAGARGLSLGNAWRLTHFEPPTTYERWTQRSNRVHRVDSVPDRVSVDCLVAARSLDLSALRQVHTCNDWQDQLLDSEADSGSERLSAADRRRMLAEALADLGG